MKVPVQWLGEYIDVESIGVERLANVLTMAGLEVEEIDESAIGPVFVTKVTPNRGDWMSILGVAREAAAALSVTQPIELKPIKFGGAVLPYQALSVPIRIDTPSWCPRYAAMIVEIDHPGTSPQWMQERLIAAGMRPINAIVDVTNYVMIELGQPLHAFDLDTMAGPEIIVRAARDGETIITLDGKERSLSSSMLVIADRDKPSALAGIMGGEGSEVTDKTRRVLIESAHFDPMVVRAAAKVLGISTDASYRFERYVDPNGVSRAMLAASQLMAEIVGGHILEASTDVYPQPITPVAIPYRESRAQEVLGVALSEIQNSYAGLRAMGFSWDGAAGTISVPTWRHDVVKQIDLIEEVGRMVGYENLPETLPAAQSSHGGGRDSDAGYFTSRVRSILIGQGLNEIFSHTLSAPSPFDDSARSTNRVIVRSALSAELSGLRTSLIPNLLDTLGRNARQRTQEIALFEVGHVFATQGPSDYRQYLRAAAVIQGDYTNIKGIVENIFAGLNISSPEITAYPWAAMHPNRSARLTIGEQEIGFIAEADPDLIAENLDIPSSFGRVGCFELDLDVLYAIMPAATSYFPLPRYPEVTRDLAMLFDLDAPFGAIQRVARLAAGPYVESVSLVSVYTGERVESGKKSVALRFVLRAQDKTLTDADADSAKNAAQLALAENLGALAR